MGEGQPFIEEEQHKITTKGADLCCKVCSGVRKGEEI